MRAAGGTLRPAAGRPGDRLHPRDPAGVPVPARPRPRLLRLQAGQPHPGRRRRQADRPRRGAPPRRPRLRDLRHRRLPGPGGARASGPSVASDIYTIGRTLVVLAMEFRGYQSTYVASLPPVDETPLFQRARLALPAAAQGVRARPGRPVRLGRRAARAAARRAARGRGRSSARARPSTRRPPCSSTCRRSPTTPCDWQDLPRLRADDSDPQMPWLRTVSIDDPVAAAGRPRECARRTAPRCCSPRRAPRSRPGSYERVDEAVRALLADDPWEWRAVWMSGLVALARRQDGRGAERLQRGLRPGARRAGAQAGARRSPARPAATPTSPSRLYVVCARTDANYIAPAAFGLARIRAGRGRRRRARSRALDLVPATSRAFTQARRRRAGLLAESGGGLPSLAAALDSIESLTIDPVDRSRFRVEVLQLGARAGGVARRRHHGLDRWAAGGRAGPARRARGGLPRPGRLRRQPGGAGPPRRPGQRGPPMDAAMTEPGVGGAVGQVEPSVGDRSQGDGGHLSCPSCSAHVAAGERFCEACGADLGPPRRRPWRLRPRRRRLRTSRRRLRTSRRQLRTAFGSAVLP